MTAGNSRHRWVSVGPRSSRSGSNFLKYLLVGLDAAALTMAWAVAAVLAPPSARSTWGSVVVVLALVVGGLAVFGAFGLYRARVCNLRTVEYERLFRGCLIVALLALAVASVRGSVVRPREIVLGAALAWLFAGVFRGGYRTWLTSGRRAGRHVRPVLLVGGGAESAELAALLAEHPELGYRSIGVVGDEREARRHGLEECWCGGLGDGLAVLAERGVNGAIVCGSDLQSAELNAVVQDLLHAGVHVQLSSGLHGVDVGRLRPSPLAHEPFFYVEPVTLVPWQLLAKRVVDVALSAVILLLTLPLLALAALGIKLQDRGPVLFKQWRVGRDGEPFVLYKLRTMREGAEHEVIDLPRAQRARRPAHQAPARSAGDHARPHLAGDEHRRAPPALERAERHDEPRGAPACLARRGRPLRRRAPCA